MIKEWLTKISRIIKNSEINVRMLGIYIAVILFLFTLGVPIIKSLSERGFEETHNSDISYTDKLVEEDIESVEKNTTDTEEYIQDDKDREKENNDLEDNNFTDNEKKNNGNKDNNIVDNDIKDKEDSDPKVDNSNKIMAVNVDDATKEISPDSPQADTVASVVKEDNPAQTTLGDMIWPLRGEVIRGLGLVYSATYGDYRYHDGIDIKGAAGDEIVAVRTGKVIRIETTKGDGISVLIEHSDGLQSEYKHLSEANLEKGKTVQAGQRIGTIGNPGLNEAADGPHVHFGMIKDGQVVDPLKYLP